MKRVEQGDLTPHMLSPVNSDLLFNREEEADNINTVP